MSFQYLDVGVNNTFPSQSEGPTGMSEIEVVIQLLPSLPPTKQISPSRGLGQADQPRITEEHSCLTM